MKNVDKLLSLNDNDFDELTTGIIVYFANTYHDELFGIPEGFELEIETVTDYLNIVIDTETKMTNRDIMRDRDNTIGVLATLMVIFVITSGMRKNQPPIDPQKLVSYVTIFMEQDKGNE